MAYGEKYKYYFYWDHNSSNNYYKVSFLEDGYASTVTTLTPGVNPFTIMVRGQKDSIDQTIIGSSASMEIIVDKSDVDTIDGDFLSIAYKDMIVKLIEDPDGTPLTKWVGIILPENSTREFLGYKFSYQFEAVDGLASLKDFYYSGNGTKNGTVYNGFQDMLEIIKIAISKLADSSITDLQLDFRVQLNTYSDQMVSTENALKENEVVQELFYQQDAEGNITFDDCYTVISKILAPFNCVMSQSDGYFQIWNPAERSSFYFEYDWSTLTQQSRTSRNRTITFQGISLPYSLYGRGTFSKLQPENRFIATVYNRAYNPELITNGTFDANITGWTNGDAAASANTFTSFAWYDYPSIGGTLGAAYSGGGAAASYYFHTTSTFSITVGAGAPDVNINLLCEWNSVTTTGSGLPECRMRLYNATDTYTAGSIGYKPFFKVGGFTGFSDTIDVTGLSVGTNYLEVEIKVTDANATAIQFYFDNIQLSQESTSVPVDFAYQGALTSGKESKTGEGTFYISDQIESTADICSIKDAGGTYTSTWDRYTETDTLSLISIWLQQRLNARSTYQDYITCQAYDPDQTIEIFSILYFSELGLSIRYGDIIGMTKNYRQATIELEIKGSGAEVSDVTIYYLSSNLGTQYGSSI